MARGCILLHCTEFHAVGIDPACLVRGQAAAPRHSEEPPMPPVILPFLRCVSRPAAKVRARG